MTTKIRVCLLAFALAAPAIRAETLYVIEQLAVNVNNAPGGAGERIATIKSAAHVETLERQNDEFHVRLANGREGWIKAAYLSPQPPLQQRLNDRTAEVEKLRQDVSRLESELATARLAASAAASTPVPANNLGSDPPTATATPASGAATASATGVRDTPLFMTPPEQPARPAWQWVLGSSAVTLVIGFLLGWYVLDRRILRKYGGLRIY